MTETISTSSGRGGVRYSQSRTADLGVRALDELLRGLTPQSYRAGEVLIRQGEPSTFALFLTEGSVGVFGESAYDRIQLAELDAPRLIGELGVLAGMPRTATIETITPVKAIRIERAQLRDIGVREPEFLLSVIAQLGGQLDGTNRALNLYGNALTALERREFDPGILDELSHPSPQLVTFANTFKRFANQIADKRRQSDELASAAVIQRSFLPRPDLLKPIAKRIELSAQMRPARDVGGDFYDYFLLDRDHLGIAIGDVCGKGIPASLFMAVTMTTLRSAGQSDRDVARALERTNMFLSADNDASMFATLFYGVLNLKTGTLDYGNCGHNAPYVLSPAGRRSLPTTGIPVGLLADRNAGAGQVTLAPGDTLVLFTDGVTEAMNPLDDQYGNERLEALLGAGAARSPADLVSDIFASVDAFADGADQADDITCLILRRSA